MKEGEEIAVSSKGAIRIGPAYFFLLLPTEVPRLPPVPLQAGAGAASSSSSAASGAGGSSAASSAAGVGAGGTGTGGGGGGGGKVPRGWYKRLIDDIYNRHFSEQGFFSTTDLVRLIMAEWKGGDGGGPPKEDQVRTNVNRHLAKAESGFESVETSTVPGSVVESSARLHAGRGKKAVWWKRSTPEATRMRIEAEREKKAKAAAASSAGGAGGGGAAAAAAAAAGDDDMDGDE